MRAAATPGRRSSRHAVRRVVDLRPPDVIYYAEDDASDSLRLFGRLEGQAQMATSSDRLLLLPTTNLLGCGLCWLIRCMNDACKMHGKMHDEPWGRCMEDDKRRRMFTAMRLSRVAVVVRCSRREPRRQLRYRRVFLWDRDVLSLLPVFSVMVK